MSLIYLIRHGQASFGHENYDRLSELGRKQSQILGDYFARSGVVFDAVYAGSLQRQQATARNVMARISTGNGKPPFHIRPEFNEHDTFSIIRAQAPAMIREDASLSPAFESVFTDPRSFQKIQETAMLRWMSGMSDIPGVETWESFTRRVQSGITQVMAENGRRKSIAIFTSGGAICAVMRMVLGLSNEITITLARSIRNTSVSLVQYNDQRLGLSFFNSSAHLELHNQPELLTYG
ncbi:MAG: histidine phosphatase family protein [Deltaproteobacteria bacterium]|nr:histidine phosphatase family protein [Deltaproteobacteria bacterium]